MAAPTPAPEPQRGGRLLGLTSLFPPLGLGVVGVLGHVRELPRVLQLTLGVFAVTQLVAALLTPSPLLSVALAAVRSALVAGWVTYGFQAGPHLRLSPLAWALAALSLAALALAAWLRLSAGPDTLLPTALEFLYVTSNSMSIFGMVMVLLALLGPRHWHLTARLPLGVLGSAVMVLGQGRTAWLALGAALLLGLRGRWATPVRLTALALAALTLALPQGRGWVQAAASDSLSGRERIWSDGVQIAQTFPLGGTGPYQYGAYASPFVDPCTTLRTLETVLPTCPAWVQHIGQPWVIAHSGVLHPLAETGMVGTLGWLLLYGTVLLGAWRSGWPLARAVIGGLLVINLLDNATLLPSPGYAELFLALGGAAWAAQRRLSEREAPTVAPGAPAVSGQAAALGAGVGLLTAAVPWWLVLPQQPAGVEVQRLLTPGQYQAGEVYGLYADLRWTAPQGAGYLSVEQCSPLNICQHIGGAAFEGGQLADWVYARLQSEDPTVILRAVATNRERPALPVVLETWEVKRVDPQGE